MLQKKTCKSNGEQGFTFGIMEGTILLMGLMLGLHVTNNKAITVLALIVTALADSFANSAGFHVAQETEANKSQKEVWLSTILCFVATFFVMLILVVPILLFPSFDHAVIVSSILAIVILGLLGAYVAKKRNENMLSIAVEYIFIGAVAAIICFFLGELSEDLILSII